MFYTSQPLDKADSRVLVSVRFRQALTCKLLKPLCLKHYFRWLLVFHRLVEKPVEALFGFSFEAFR